MYIRLSIYISEEQNKAGSHSNGRREAHILMVEEMSTQTIQHTQNEYINT